MKKYVIIRTEFVALHKWSSCPFEEVFYLRNPHRHIFKVKVKFAVSHSDRDIEFFMKKKDIDDYLGLNFNKKDIGDMSCEEIAERILVVFDAVSVEVSEDGENGAEVCYED